jgi:hypothetical protein
MQRKFLTCLCLLFLVSCARHDAQPPVGDWDATVITPNGERVSFRFHVEQKGTSISGSLINGEDRNESTSGSFDGETLRLRFDYYDGDLVARYDDQVLHGAFTRQWRRETLSREFSAQRVAERPPRTPLIFVLSWGIG